MNAITTPTSEFDNLCDTQDEMLEHLANLCDAYLEASDPVQKDLLWSEIGKYRRLLLKSMALQIFLGSPTIGPELAQRLRDGREATNNDHDHELANSLRAIFLRQSGSESQPGPQHPAHTPTNAQPEREPEQRTEVNPAQQQHEPEPEPDLSPEWDGELRSQRAQREEESTPSWWIPHPIFKPPSSKPRWLPHTNPDRIIPRRPLRAEPFGPFLERTAYLHPDWRQFDTDERKSGEGRKEAGEGGASEAKSA